MNGQKYPSQLNHIIFGNICIKFSELVNSFGTNVTDLKKIYDIIDVFDVDSRQPKQIIGIIGKSEPVPFADLYDEMLRTVYSDVINKSDDGRVDMISKLSKLVGVLKSIN